MDVLPFPSVYDQWMVYVPCTLYVNASVVVPVTLPTQLSVALGTVAVAEHCPVTVGNVLTFATGAVTS